MKPRTVAVLALVVIGLGTFLWLVDRDLPSSEERGERARRVLGLDADDAARVVALELDGDLVAPVDDAPVRLERPAPASDDEAGSDETDEAALDGAAEAVDPRPWRLVAPVSGRADQAAVERLVAELVGLEATRTLDGDDAPEPAAVGLDEPRAVVTVELVGDDGAQERRTLRVGAAVPGASTVVVGLDDGAPRVVPDAFLAHLERSIDAWRDRRPVDVLPARVERVVLSGSDDGSDGGVEPVVLVRRDEGGPAGAAAGGFEIEGPLRDVADRQRLEELLEAATELTVERFVAPDSGRAPGTIGLAPPRATVRLETDDGDGEAVVIEVGDPVEDAPGLRWVRLDGATIQAATDLAELAATPAEAWRSRAWTRLRPFEVERLEVERDRLGAGTDGLVLERQGVDWTRGGAGAGVAGEPIGYGVVSDLLDAVLRARGELAPASVAEARDAGATGGATEGSTDGLDDRILVLHLGTGSGTGPGDGSSAGEPVETLVLGPETPEGYPARSSARPTVLLLSPSTVAGIRAALEGVRGAEVLAGAGTEGLSAP